MDTILWEGSGWTKPGMAELVDKSRVKRAYMRANLIVHPDKVAQKGGTTEQVCLLISVWFCPCSHCGDSINQSGSDATVMCQLMNSRLEASCACINC